VIWWSSNPVTERKRVRTYQDLTAWQKAFDLRLDIYRVTKRFPKAEVYGLSTQMQRAAVSILSIIAEGFGRRTTADFLRLPYIACGSICEVQTQALPATKLCYLRAPEADRLLQLIGDTERLTKALIRALGSKRPCASAT